MIEVKNSLNGELNASIVKEYPELEDVEITPTLEDQIVKSDMYGINEVLVRGIDAKEIRIEPMIEEQTQEGLFKKVIVGPMLDTSDADATSEDIAEGKTAYVNNQKVTGTFVPLDTSDATATAADIVEGKTAYVNGEKIIGELQGQSQDYKILEYIESDGKAYIDSGIKCATTVGAELTVYTPVDYNNVNPRYFGVWNNDTGILFHLNGYAASKFYKINYNANSTGIASKLKWHNFVYDPINYIYTIDGKNLSISDSTQNKGSECTLYLFRANDGDPDGDGTNIEVMSGVRISCCKICNNEKLVRLFVPVIRLSDNVVCMYDAVSRTFFENAGTGTFTAGPEL